MAAFIPLIAAVVSAGAGMYAQSEASSSQKRAQEEAQQAAFAAEQRAVQREKDLAAQNEAKWKEYAFPSEAELTEKRNSATAELGSERTNRLDQLARNASIRGWGSGSGSLAKAASGIEQSYLSSLGNSITSLNEYAMTPRFSYPFQSGTLGQANTGASGNAYQVSSTNPLSTALGYLAGTYSKKNNSYAAPTVLQEQNYSLW